MTNSSKTQFLLREIEMEEDGGVVELWWVQGIDNTLYPTKQAAEMAARRSFPNEDWYQRVYYRKYYSEIQPNEEPDDGDREEDDVREDEQEAE